MNDGIGGRVFWVDAVRLRQPRAVAGLNRGEAKPPLHVAGRDEADPARAEHAHAVVEDHVMVGPAFGCARRHRCFAALGLASLSARSSSGPALFTPLSVSASQWPSLPDAASTRNSTLPPLLRKASARC